MNFTVKPDTITSATEVKVDCGFDTVILTNKNGVFSGMAQFPINENYYQVYAKVYEDGVLVEDTFVDEITAGMAVQNMAAAMYDGFVQYGNNRLVLEGDLTYKTNFAEEIISTKIVCGDEIKEMNEKETGVKTLSCVLDKGVTKKIYVEMELKDGGKVRLYPEIYDENMYVLDHVEFNDDSFVSGNAPENDQYSVNFSQEGTIEIVTKDGKSYSMYMG